jgi:hypothetical protein
MMFSLSLQLPSDYRDVDSLETQPIAPSHESVNQGHNLAHHRFSAEKDVLSSAIDDGLSQPYADVFAPTPSELASAAARFAAIESGQGDTSFIHAVSRNLDRSSVNHDESSSILSRLERTIAESMSNKEPVEESISSQTSHETLTLRYKAQQALELAEKMLSSRGTVNLGVSDEQIRSDADDEAILMRAALNASAPSSNVPSSSTVSSTLKSLNARVRNELTQGYIEEIVSEPTKPSIPIETSNEPVVSRTAALDAAASDALDALGKLHEKLNSTSRSPSSFALSHHQTKSTERQLSDEEIAAEEEAASLAAVERRYLQWKVRQGLASISGEGSSDNVVAAVERMLPQDRIVPNPVPSGAHVAPMLYTGAPIPEFHAASTPPAAPLIPVEELLIASAKVLERGKPSALLGAAPSESELPSLSSSLVSSVSRAAEGVVPSSVIAHAASQQLEGSGVFSNRRQIPRSYGLLLEQIHDPREFAEDQLRATRTINKHSLDAPPTDLNSTGSIASFDSPLKMNLTSPASPPKSSDHMTNVEYTLAAVKSTVKQVEARSNVIAAAKASALAAEERIKNRKMSTQRSSVTETHPAEMPTSIKSPPKPALVSPEKPKRTIGSMDPALPPQAPLHGDEHSHDKPSRHVRSSRVQRASSDKRKMDPIAADLDETDQAIEAGKLSRYYSQMGVSSKPLSSVGQTAALLANASASVGTSSLRIEVMMKAQQAASDNLSASLHESSRLHASTDLSSRIKSSIDKGDDQDADLADALSRSVFIPSPEPYVNSSQASAPAQYLAEPKKKFKEGLEFVMAPAKLGQQHALSQHVAFVETLNNTQRTQGYQPYTASKNQAKQTPYDSQVKTITHIIGTRDTEVLKEKIRTDHATARTALI